MRKRKKMMRERKRRKYSISLYIQKEKRRYQKNSWENKQNQPLHKSLHHHHHPHHLLHHHHHHHLLLLLLLLLHHHHHHHHHLLHLLHRPLPSPPPSMSRGRYWRRQGRGTQGTGNWSTEKESNRPIIIFSMGRWCSKEQPFLSTSKTKMRIRTPITEVAHLCRTDLDIDIYMISITYTDLYWVVFIDGISIMMVLFILSTNPHHTFLVPTKIFYCNI